MYTMYRIRISKMKVIFKQKLYIQMKEKSLASVVYQLMK